jgi:hypothetical protein
MPEKKDNPVRSWPDDFPEALRHKSVADVIEMLERGKIGHRLAMQYFRVEAYNDLVSIVHANGRRMPGHIPHKVSPETRAVLRRALGLTANAPLKRAASPQKMRKTRPQQKAPR